MAGGAGGPAVAPQGLRSRTERRIFVALAAYREPELKLTIQDCLAKADRPESLRFGICLQHDVDGGTGDPR